MSRDIVVVGASSGGVEALKTFVGGLPRDLGCAVFVVLHSASTSPGLLPSILDRAGDWPVSFGRDGDEFEPGRIYVAPPDRHLLLVKTGVALSRGPKHNHFRPAIDPLFQSAAFFYGPRVIGVVLSGVMDDGAAGLLAIKTVGGRAVVQDPADALYPEMPCSAMNAVTADSVLPAKRMGAALSRYSRERTSTSFRAPRDLQDEITAMLEASALLSIKTSGTPSPLTCPQCGGVLNALPERRILRFQCQVGHVYSAKSLLTDQSRALEIALWDAVRMLEERANLFRMLRDREKAAAPAYQELIDDTRRHADLLRELIGKIGGLPEAPGAKPPGIAGEVVAERPQETELRKVTAPASAERGARARSLRVPARRKRGREAPPPGGPPEMKGVTTPPGGRKPS